MTIRYEIDDAQHLIRTRVTGTVSDEDLVRQKRRLRADPRYRPGMRQLADVRGVETLDVTAAGIRQMTVMDAGEPEQLSGRRLAIVATADVAYGMARMYQQSAEGTRQSIGVFRSVEEAEEWLGLDDDPPPSCPEATATS